VNSELIEKIVWRGEMMRGFLLSIIILLTCLAPLTVAQEPDSPADSVIVRRAKFTFDDPTGRNIVMFTSQAPLETIIGRTSALYGFIDFDLDSLPDNPEVFFECDLRSLKTGIDLRDEHMRSDGYLAADSFPIAEFRLISIFKTNNDVIFNETVANLTGRGEFILHGVVDTVTVTAEITYFEANEVTETRLPGDIVKFKADFDIRMSDYGITIPEEAILKLDDRIHVHIDAFGGTGVEPMDRTVVDMPPEEPADQPVEEETEE
jgi:polyisoprenoid-binding protein YceI